MEVCAASVQGAVVPDSEYAFAALTCGVLSVSSLCVLPDFGLGLANDPSVSRHTSNLVHDKVFEPLLGGAAAFRGCSCVSQSNFERSITCRSREGCSDGCSSLLHAVMRSASHHC